ncbi:MAG: DUF4397 domain-containing protein [Pseudorhodobacter sp.]|nr:DUF4397 domain-containing protein [Frankiaceae bacterium]
MPRSFVSPALRLAAAGALAAAPLALAVPVAQAATGTALVTVVHGIPNTPVDVYVDGAKALSTFTFGTVTGPISLPAGPHAIAVRAAGAAASSAPILKATASLMAGENATIVANLTADGKPALTPFENPTAAVPSGMARIVVRHTAAAPAVDVLAGGTAVIKALTNPNSSTLMVPAGVLKASVAAAGTTAPVIGPVSLNLKSGTTTIVYAIGSLSGKTLTAATQTYGSSSAMPTGVAAGSGGQAADQGAPLLGLALLGSGALLVGTRTVRARRSVTAGR